MTLKSLDTDVNFLDFLDTQNNHTICINTIPQGEDYDQRIGYQALIRHIHIHAFIGNANLTNTSCRILIYNDRQHNGSANYLTQGELLHEEITQTYFNSHANPWTADRVQFLYDSTYDIQSRNNGVTYGIDIQIPNLNILTVYGGVAAQKQSINTNAIFIEAIESIDSPPGDVTLTGIARVYYLDK